MPTHRRIAASAARAAIILLLCASPSHATSEQPFDEGAVLCDGGCLFEYGDDGSVSLSAAGEWIEVIGELSVAGDFSISATTVIVSAVISSTASLTIDAAERVAFAAGSSVYARSSRPNGVRSPGTASLEGSLVLVGATLTAIGGESGAVFLSAPPALNEVAVFAASEIAAAPLMESETRDAGGSTLIVNIIPEPKTAVLLAAGLTLLGVARRR